MFLRPADDRLAEPVMGCSIRTDRYRFTEWGEGRHGVELYGHHTDPLEFHNLALESDASLERVIDRLRPILRSRATGKTPVTPFNPARLKVSGNAMANSEKRWRRNGRHLVAAATRRVRPSSPSP